MLEFLTAEYAEYAEREFEQEVTEEAERISFCFCVW